MSTCANARLQKAGWQHPSWVALGMQVSLTQGGPAAHGAGCNDTVAV